MATYTENLNLSMPAPTDKALITVINQNMQKLDAVVGGIHAHIWVRWSAAEPTQDADLKDTPDAWMGIYTGALAHAPSAYTAYAWYPCKGSPGERGESGTGNNWYAGTAITGVSVTPVAYPTGISAAQAGDMYLNVGALPDIGRIYRCTLGGDENTALWSYVAAIRGADGTDGTDGRGIVSITRTSGTGTPGTTDTYTITYSDETTDTFDIYNGANGAGAGDMLKATYDPQGKNTDAFSRSNHTGTQTASTISDFAAAVRDTLLTGLSTVASTAIAATDSILTAHAKLQAQITAHKNDTNNPHGVTAAQVGAIPTSQKGAANGVAELDSSGKVLTAQLPSYVDDVLEYASSSAFPVTGESGKIYVALDTNKVYRWSGSSYVEISASLALGETSGTAYRGDRGKTAYDHSQATGNPHNTTASDVGAAELDANGKVDPEQACSKITDVSTSKTLALSDAGCQQRCMNSTAITITIPTNTSVAFPVGTEIEFVMYGAGSVTIAGASGVTLKSENDYHTVCTQNHIFAIKQEATDEWLLAGMEE